MAEPLRIALAGLGTVGAGVIRLLAANAALVRARAGREIRIVAVSARDRDRDRGVDLNPFEWCDDMTAMAARGDIDAVVEMVGGADGPALTLAKTAIREGKALVTANKAMIAHHGLELAAAAKPLERLGREHAAEAATDHQHLLFSRGLSVREHAKPHRC